MSDLRLDLRDDEEVNDCECGSKAGLFELIGMHKAVQCLDHDCKYSSCWQSSQRRVDAINDWNDGIAQIETWRK